LLRLEELEKQAASENLDSESKLEGGTRAESKEPISFGGRREEKVEFSREIIDGPMK
jgi:hypothetical protein